MSEFNLSKKIFHKGEYNGKAQYVIRDEYVKKFIKMTIKDLELLERTIQSDKRFACFKMKALDNFKKRAGEDLI